VPEQDSGDQVRLARAALAAAKADARARGLRPTAQPRRTAVKPAGAPAEGAAGAATEASQDARSGDGVAGGPVPGPLTAGTTGSGAPAGGAPGAGVPAAGARGGTRRPAARPGFAAQPPRDDPQPLGAAINGLLDAEGWSLAAATGSVFGRWAQIVGSDLAAHTTPETLSDGELTVSADSTAWATQVRLLAAQLVRRLNSELGDGTVVRVKVKGPVTSTRKPGEWRVRGGRGPRDTYG
jgi:predicted nucleic acid-binding Zn ribbon protein